MSSLMSEYVDLTGLLEHSSRKKNSIDSRNGHECLDVIFVKKSDNMFLNPLQLKVHHNYRGVRQLSSLYIIIHVSTSLQDLNSLVESSVNLPNYKKNIGCGVSLGYILKLKPSDIVAGCCNF